MINVVKKNIIRPTNYCPFLMNIKLPLMNMKSKGRGTKGIKKRERKKDLMDRVKLER